jgi:L-ribulose-5-phosphate 4-epimerase
VGPVSAALDPSSKAVRESVVVACRVLEAQGQGDLVWGHVSVRDPTGRGAWLKGSNLGFDEVSADDVILLDFDGNVLQGSAGLHLEYPIHTEIMRARPDVGAVVHTHPLHSIAFAATRRPLLALSHEGSHFVPPDIARFTKTGDLVSTPELGRALAETVGDRNAALMPCHGIVTASSDVGRAVALAIRLERACQVALLAGEGAVGSDDEEALQKRARSTRNLGMAWEYLARHVTGAGPG